jgi:hypothetical protein
MESRTRAAVLAIATAFLIATSAFAANPVQIENAKLGDPDWDAYPEARNGEVEGYASSPSVNIGETISFYVNSSESTYMIEFYRMGWYNGLGARKMLGPIIRTGTRQTIPAPDATTGLVECNWVDPYVLTIPNDWVSGVYMALLVGGQSNKKKYIPFVVRDDARPSTHYFQSAVTTAQAYNSWGGKSLYSFNSGCSTVSSWRAGCGTSGTPAVKVSFNRPYQDGGGSGDFLWNWEYNMVRFLEREGYDVTYSTSLDTARRGSLLLNHKDFLSVGHDEYWSWDMRSNVEYARDHGISLGFFSANVCYWQIRLEASKTGVADRTIVAYKETAATKDPFATDKDRTNDNLVTTNWRSSPVNKPESSMVGVMYVYDQSNMANDIVIDNVTSAPWVFSNTGATSGTHLAGLLGYEIDAISTGSPSNNIRLAHSPFTNTKLSPPTTQFSDMVTYTAASGATVFATGTIQWSWGLDDYNSSSRPPNAVVSSVAQQITRNVLQKFAGSSSAADCQYTISPAAASVTGAAGSGTFSVSTTTNCAWSPVSSAPWLTITSGATSSGNGTLTYAFAQNAGSTRTATITIGDKVFTVSQAACTFSLSKLAQNYSTAAVSDTVTISAPAGCAWTASSNQTWVTITSATSGSGDGTIAFNIAANTGDARDAVLTIGGIAFSIHQASGCTYTVAPASLNAGAATASGTIALTTSASNCTWTASATSWITITTAKSGSGNASIGYTIAANPGSARDGSITIGSAQVAVHQANGCTFSVAPTSASYGASGSRSEVATLTASAADCVWTAAADAAWVTLTGSNAGTGTASIPYAVDANSSAARDAKITFTGGATLAIHEATGCTYNVSPASASFGAAATNATFAVSTSGADCPWTASTNAGWITITSAKSGAGNGGVNVSIAANTGPARDGTLTIDGQTIAIHQANGCTFTISPASTNYTKSGGSGTATLTASASTCPWTAATDAASWITLSTPSGTGNATLRYTVASNTGSARSAAITVGNATHAVTQDGGCTVTASPASASYPASSATGRLDVTASNSNCLWTAATAASWISVAPGSGSGSATVSYTLTANNGAARNAVITVGTQNVGIQQASGCTYAINPSSAHFAAAGGQANVNLTASSSDCPWTATSSAPWITIGGAASGTGNASIVINAAGNTGAARNGSATIGGAQFLIDEDGCSYSVSPASANFGAAGATASFAVTANAGTCPWTATTTASWITINSGASGSGTGSVNVSIAANNGPARDATLTIDGQNVAIHQASGCTFTISPASANYAKGGGSGSATVTASSSTCPWTAVTDAASWITLTTTSGSGSSTLRYTVASNNGSARSAAITVDTAKQTVTQDGGCTVTASPASASYSAAAASGQIDVNASNANCSWTATTAASWMTVAPGSGSGSGTVSYTVNANNGAARNAVITVGTQNVAIQQASGCTYAINPSSAHFAAAGGQANVNLTSSSSDCPWTATASAPWITISGAASGTGNAAITIAVAANPGIARSGTVTIGGEPFTIDQDNGCTIALSPANAKFTKAGGSASATVTASAPACPWSIANGATWIQVATPSGTGNATVSYTVASNAGAARSATLKAGTSTLDVDQDGGCTVSVSPASASYSAAQGGGRLDVYASSAECGWSATTTSAWIGLNAPSGTGNGSLTYTVAANAGAARDATVTIGTQDVIIHQESGCTYALDATTASVGASASSGSVKLTTSAADCAWTASPGAAWITISAPASGKGSATIAYNIAANDGAPRDGIITIADKSLTIFQGSGCTFSVSPSSATMQPAGGTSSVTLTASSASCTWTAASDSAWVTLQAASGSGSATIGFTVARNDGAPRDAMLNIAGQPVAIHQTSGCTYSVTPSSIDAAAAGAHGSLTLQASAPGCTWSAGAGAAWVTFANATGSGSATIDYDIAKNTGNVRDTTITVAGQSVPVHQGNGCTYSVSQDAFAFSSDGGSGSVSIATDATCFWSSSSSMTWVTISTAADGKGPASTTFTVAPNSGGPRNGYIIVAGKTVTITQAGSGGVLGAPTGVRATATSPTHVSLAWVPVGGASGYQIFRTDGSGYTMVGTAETNAFEDNGVTANTAYLYRVRAINANTSSGDSTADLATTVMFTDDPIMPRQTVIKAVHLTELRTAVNAVRRLAGLSAADFTDSVLRGVPVKAVHIMELQRATTEALVDLGFNSAASAPQPGSAVRASDLQNARERIR